MQLLGKTGFSCKFASKIHMDNVLGGTSLRVCHVHIIYCPVNVVREGTERCLSRFIHNFLEADGCATLEAALP
jgi:hypothetical protein